MVLSVSQLPVELIHAIALSCDTKVRRSASYIVWLGSTSHHLRSALRESHIWKVLYNEQYMHANPDSEVARRALRQEDYLLLFQDRRRLDKGLLSALDHLIDTGEREHLCRFIAKHRHDVQDFLEPLPPNIIRRPVFVTIYCKKVVVSTFEGPTGTPFGRRHLHIIEK